MVKQTWDIDSMRSKLSMDYDVLTRRIVTILSAARKDQFKYINDCAEAVEFYRNGKLMAEKRIIELQEEIQRLGGSAMDYREEELDPLPTQSFMVKIEALDIGPDDDDDGDDDGGDDDYFDDTTAFEYYEEANESIVDCPAEYECIDCSSKFTANGQLTAHWQQCATRQANLKLNKLSAAYLNHVTPNADGFYDCPHPNCPRLFKLRTHLIAHTKTHMPGNHQRYKCAECRMNFTNKLKYMQHMRTHLAQNPIKCPDPDCDQVFKSRIEVTQHARIHQNIRPHQCEVCGFNFTAKSSLVRHQRIHLGERPFACPIEGCDHRFTRKSHLEDHINRHTGLRPYACDWNGCGLTFKRKSYMEKHKKTHLVQDNEVMQALAAQFNQ